MRLSDELFSKSQEISHSESTTAWRATSHPCRAGAYCPWAIGKRSRFERSVHAATRRVSPSACWKDRLSGPKRQEAAVRPSSFKSVQNVARHIYSRSSQAFLGLMHIS